MRSRTVKNYFKSFFNFVDLAGYLCNLFWGIIFLMKTQKYLADNKDSENTEWEDLQNDALDSALE